MCRECSYNAFHNCCSPSFSLLLRTVASDGGCQCGQTSRRGYLLVVECHTSLFDSIPFECFALLGYVRSSQERNIDRNVPMNQIRKTSFPPPTFANSVLGVSMGTFPCIQLHWNVFPVVLSQCVVLRWVSWGRGGGHGGEGKCVFPELKDHA